MCYVSYWCQNHWMKVTDTFPSLLESSNAQCHRSCCEDCSSSSFSQSISTWWTLTTPPMVDTIYIYNEPGSLVTITDHSHTSVMLQHPPRRTHSSTSSSHYTPKHQQHMWLSRLVWMSHWFHNLSQVSYLRSPLSYDTCTCLVSDHSSIHQIMINITIQSNTHL